MSDVIVMGFDEEDEAGKGQPTRAVDPAAAGAPCRDNISVASPGVARPTTEETARAPGASPGPRTRGRSGGSGPEPLGGGERSEPRSFHLAVILASRGDFASTLAARREPVLVDFSASWCGPCQAMAPALEAFAERRRNELAVVKLDVDEASDIAARYAIRSVPTLMLFKDGKPLAKQAGMMGEAQLERFVAKHLPREEREPAQQDPARPQVDLHW